MKVEMRYDAHVHSRKMLAKTTQSLDDNDADFDRHQHVRTFISWKLDIVPNHKVSKIRVKKMNTSVMMKESKMTYDKSNKNNKVDIIRTGLNEKYINAVNDSLMKKLKSRSHKDMSNSLIEGIQGGKN